MYCSNCGNEIKDSKKFCDKCRSKIKIKNINNKSELKSWEKTWKIIFWGCIVVFFSSLLAPVIISYNVLLYSILKLLMFCSAICECINLIVGVILKYKETKNPPYKLIITILTLIVILLIAKIVASNVEQKRNEFVKNNYDNNLKTQDIERTLIDLKNKQKYY